MMKELKSCIGKYKLPSVLTSLFVALEVVMEVLIPFFMSNIIDKE